jgi:hypothetical protein
MKKGLIVGVILVVLCGLVIVLTNRYYSQLLVVEKSTTKPIVVLDKIDKTNPSSNKNTSKTDTTTQPLPLTTDVELSALVEQILNEPNHQTASSLIHQLNRKSLTIADFQALTDLLKTSPSSTDADLALHSMKNELILALIANGQYLPQLEEAFINILKDQNQHPVLTDYILQYVSNYFDKRWNKQDSEEQQAFIDLLYRQLQRQEDSIAGTALNALTTLSQDYSRVDQQLISQQAFNMANNINLTQASRSAAIHYLAKENNPEAKNLLTQLTFDNSSPVMLRMAAINALSEQTIKFQGERASLIQQLQQEFLQEKSNDQRLKTAASAALTKLQQNLN